MALLFRRAEDTVKGMQHPRRSSPDVAPLVRHGVVVARAAVDLVAVPLVVGRIEKEGEWYFEHFGDLERIRRKLKRRLDPPNHRRYAEAGRYVPLRQGADDLPSVGCDTDLLGGLSQRRGY